MVDTRISLKCEKLVDATLQNIGVKEGSVLDSTQHLVS